MNCYWRHSDDKDDVRGRQWRHKRDKYRQWRHDEVRQSPVFTALRFYSVDGVSSPARTRPVDWSTTVTWRDFPYDCIMNDVTLAVSATLVGNALVRVNYVMTYAPVDWSLAVFRTNNVAYPALVEIASSFRDDVTPRAFADWPRDDDVTDTCWQQFVVWFFLDGTQVRWNADWTITKPVLSTAVVNVICQQELCPKLIEAFC